VDGYTFVDPMIDLRGHAERADVLGSELVCELPEGHILHGRPWRIIAEAAPQDEVVVDVDGRIYLVHLTWSKYCEQLPYPRVEEVASADDLEQLIKYRY
jgi:hypothetical protein